MKLKALSRGMIYLVLVIGSVLILYPLFLVVITSLKTAGEATVNPIGLPSVLAFDNYAVAYTRGNVGRSILNSVIYTVFSVSSVIVVSLMAAYTLSRFVFRGSKILQYYLLSGLMIPFQVILVPVFRLIRLLNLFNNMLSIILIHIALGIPFAIFLYTGYLKSLPKDIEESAYIDGCGYYRMLWKIVAPVTLPATATIATFNLLAVWNDFFIPLVFITSKNLKPVQLAIYSFVGEYTSDWNVLFACMVMAIIPVLLIYLLLQKYFMSGMLSGALKG